VQTGWQNEQGHRPRMTASHLDTLNDRQRTAVVHGIEPEAAGGDGPLLIIAGAGSGKTNTLAHRVAHLILNGADPHPADDLFAPRRIRDEPARRADLPQGTGQ